MKEGHRPTRKTIFKHLYKGVVNLSFIKNDGSIREMNATLVSRAVPEEHRKHSLPNDPKEKDNILVWDVDQSGWRTFKMSTMESYNGLVKEI